jgi:predicted GH43/DUF377 family glycosyl hydrolase
MYYNGADISMNFRIGLAVSKDGGKNWDKFSKPILDIIPTKEESCGASDVIKIGSEYYLYYSSSNSINPGSKAKIYLALSSDGVNWKRYSGSAILAATEPKEYNDVYFPSVIYDDGIYRMIYMNRGSIDYSKSAFFMATSADGKTWNKLSSEPFFTSSMASNNWAKAIEYPYIKKFGNEYRIYYSNFYKNSTQIGLIIGY